MRDDTNRTTPPPHVLAALRRPRRGYFLAPPDLLTPEEIAALRREAKETSAFARKAFAHLRPKAKEEPNA